MLSTPSSPTQALAQQLLGSPLATSSYGEPSGLFEPAAAGGGGRQAGRGDGFAQKELTCSLARPLFPMGRVPVPSCWFEEPGLGTPDLEDDCISPLVPPRRRNPWLHFGGSSGDRRPHVGNAALPAGVWGVKRASAACPLQKCQG